MAEVNRLMTGLGSAEPILLRDGSPAIGKTLAEINLRGLTGATIVAIQRGEAAVLVPAGNEMLSAGDLLAVTGTEESLEAAQVVGAGSRRSRLIAWPRPPLTALFLSLRKP
ncbi:MAG: TrkA C-terminal domain-containing protein [Pirellulales bacterium]